MTAPLEGSALLALGPKGAGRAPLRVPVGGDDPVHQALALITLQGLIKDAVPAGGHGMDPQLATPWESGI